MCLQNNHDALSVPICSELCSKWISDCMFKDSFTLRQACKCDSLVTQPGLNRDAGFSENESQIAGTRETNTNVGWHMHVCIYTYIHPQSPLGCQEFLKKNKRARWDILQFQRGIYVQRILSIFTLWTFYGAAISHFSSSSISSIITFCHIFLLVWRMLNIVQRNVNAPRAIIVFTE